jgi:ribonuclease HI
MIVFTDGSYKNKKGGVGVFFGDDDKRNISEQLTCNKITNQVAELTAVSKALDVLINDNVNEIVYIYTDSSYVIGIFTDWIYKWFQNNWKTNGKDVKNKDLIVSIYEKIKKKPVIFKHIRAHQTEPLDKTNESYKLWYGNNKADILASFCY